MAEETDPIEETKKEQTPFEWLTTAQPFNFNAQLYSAFRPRGDKFTATDLPDNRLINDIEALSAKFLTGELPQDVVDQIQRTSAERTIQGGLSDRQGRNLTARDLGLTSLDLQQKGASIGMGVAELQTKRESFDREFALNTAQYNEDIRQWNDKFATQMVELDQGQLNLDQQAERIALAGLELESRNRQFRMSLEQGILLANAELEVPGAQDFLDTTSNVFDDISMEIEGILNDL